MDHVQYLHVKIVILHLINVMPVIAHLGLKVTHVYPAQIPTASNVTETQANALHVSQDMDLI